MNEHVARGRVVAAILAGSWRAEPPALAAADAIGADITLTALLRGGVGGLSWRRVRACDAVASTDAGRSLHDAYRRHAAEASAQASMLVRTLDAMESAGIEVLLIKGWSIARRYPSLGLRPYGDFDLVIRSDDADRAARVVEELAPMSIDLIPDFVPDAAVEGLFERSRLVDVVRGGRAVRVAGPEDELQLLAVHLVKHGGSRPLWLCDIALLLEQLPPEFDWDACLGHDPRTTSYVRAAVALAVELLGAEPLSLPASASAPRWASRAVLLAWGAAPARSGEQPGLKGVRGLSNQLRAVLARWPDPVAASFARGVPIRPSSPLPSQSAVFVELAIDFARRRGIPPDPRRRRRPDRGR